MLRHYKDISNNVRKTTTIKLC